MAGGSLSYTSVPLENFHLLSLPALAVLWDAEQELGNVLESLFPQTTMFADAVWSYLIKHKQRDLPRALPAPDGGMSSARPGRIPRGSCNRIPAPSASVTPLGHVMSPCFLLWHPRHSPAHSRPHCSSECVTARDSLLAHPRAGRALGCIPGIHR